MTVHIPEQVKAVGRVLNQGGARGSLLVGGAVVDSLQGRDPKDFDVEVFGMGIEDVARALRSVGSPKMVGAAFGIVTVHVDDMDIDVSVPRRDNKVGKGHTGFACEFDPNMTVKEAARRRDFTINTLAVDIHSGAVVDPFGGLQDLWDGVLRATDPELFVEDPLRALRAVQLVARKARTVDHATIELCRSMVDEFTELPKERVLEEWRKLLLRGGTPSRGLDFLKESGWIKHFPELEVLDGVPQHPDWHPEGDVWTHTKMAADAAAELAPFVEEKDREAFVFGTFLHDLGKATTTVTPEMVHAGKFPKERLFTAHRHDAEGVAPATAFLERIGAPKKVTRLATALVLEHMQPWNLLQGGAKRAAFARLGRRLRKDGGSLGLLARVCQCDSCATGRGRGFTKLGEPDWEHHASQLLFQWEEELGDDVVPLVQGRDLIALGLKPGVTFGPILERALALQDEGMDKDTIMEHVRSWV